MGRTGSLFAFQQYDVLPDVVSFAKGIAGGLPMSGIMANEKCRNVLGPGMQDVYKRQVHTMAKNKKDIKKIVLAYSGGLDTSIIIPWLKENYNNPEIIAVAGNVGQNDELEGLEEKAIKTGASKLYVADLVDEMVDDVIIPSMMMGAKYEEYLLGTAFARPVIAKSLVEIAKKEGADAIAHGCTGKGNDQVRFELAIKRFAPEMTIIAPWREWDLSLIHI